MWQVSRLYCIKFQPPRPGLEPSHSTPRPIIQPLRLNPPIPLLLFIAIHHIAQCISPISDTIDIWYVSCKCQQFKKVECICTLDIEQNFVIEVCVKQIFPRNSNSVNSCLSDPLERVYRSLKSKSNTGITKYQASKRGRDEYDRRACSKFNFSRLDSIWKEKKLLNVLKNCPYTSIISLLFLSPLPCLVIFWVTWFTPPRPGPMVHRLPTLVNLAIHCFVAHI